MNHLPPNKWQNADADIFWSEIARFDHVVQVYENDAIFIDTLTGFVESAIRSNENAIVIATDRHLTALESTLESRGHKIETLIAENRFIPVSAEEMLHEFFINGTMDESRFVKVISGLLQHARGNQKKVRAFGEMVAILWAQGNKEATLQLEHFWNKLAKQDPFLVYCAYSKEILTGDEKTVCNCHTRVISGSERQLSHVSYSHSLHGGPL